MRHALRHALLVLLLASCAESPQTGAKTPAEVIELGRRYVDSRVYRRDVLEHALVTSENDYSRIRLEHFATDDDDSWENLPVRRPTACPLALSDLGTFDDDGRRPASEQCATEEWRLSGWTAAELLRLGEKAFHEYPMLADSRLAGAGAGARQAASAGLWTDARRRVGGLVRERAGDSEQLAWTCATCHASVDAPGGPLVDGRSNPDIAVHRLFALGGVDHAPSAEWTPGTSDPTADGVTNPSVIPDLRAVRYQSHLHWTATVENSFPALAMRVETLLIISQGAKWRPPREVAVAIAYYLWSLAGEPDPPETGKGAQLYELYCGNCHHADGTVDGPLPWADEGLLPGRGTGTYRIPSLVGVSDRGRLMHDGSVSSMEEFMRTPPASHPRRPRLDEGQREALLRFIRRL